MKKIISLFFVTTMTFLIMNCGGRWINPWDPNSLFDPTPIPVITAPPLVFFDFNSSLTNAPPAGWSVRDDVGCSSAVVDFPSTSNKSLKLTDSNSAGAARIEYNFTSQTNRLIVEWKWNASSTGNWGRIYLSDSSPATSGDDVTAINIYLAYTMVWRNAFGTDSPIVPSFTANIWYSMKLVIDIPSKTYDIYIDNTLRVQSAIFRSPKPSISWLCFVCGLSSASSEFTYYDDVRITPY